MTEDTKERSDDQQCDQTKPSSEPRITNTQNEKEARRVEAGRRLGAISRVAKESVSNTAIVLKSKNRVKHQKTIVKVVS